MKFIKRISRAMRITLVGLLLATCIVLGTTPVIITTKEEFVVEVKIPGPGKDEETNAGPELPE